MKRKLFILLALCTCISICFVLKISSRTPRLEGIASVQEINTQDILTVSMDREIICNPIIGSGINQFYRVYKFHNQTNEPIQISHTSWIEISIDGVWYKLSSPASNATLDVPSTSTWTIDPGRCWEYPGDYLSGWRSQLKPGKYRRVFTAYFQSNPSLFYVAVEFTVL